MCARLSILLTATLLGVWTGGLAAQDSIVPGARVRLVIKAPGVSPSAPDTHTVAVKGSVVAVNGHSLLIARQTPPDTVSVPLARIFRLEVEVRESHETRGALIGAGVGVAIGLLIAIPETKKCAGVPNCYAYFHPAIIPITFGLCGGSLGGRLGRGSWRRVPIPEIGADYSPQRVAHDNLRLEAMVLETASTHSLQPTEHRVRAAQPAPEADGAGRPW